MFPKFLEYLATTGIEIKTILEILNTYNIWEDLHDKNAYFGIFYDLTVSDTVGFVAYTEKIEGTNYSIAFLKPTEFQTKIEFQEWAVRRMPDKIWYVQLKAFMRETFQLVTPQSHILQLSKHWVQKTYQTLETSEQAKIKSFILIPNDIINVVTDGSDVVTKKLVDKTFYAVVFMQSPANGLIIVDEESYVMYDIRELINLK